MVYKWYYKVIITCIHLTLRLLHLGEAISKNLYNKEKTSDATATRFCVLQNKHVMGANRPQSVMSTQSHHSPSFQEYSWLTGQMIQHVRVTPGHCSLCNIFNVQTLIFVLWESGILRFHSVWQNDVHPRFPPHWSSTFKLVFAFIPVCYMLPRSCS